jgi:hypothetical protein
MKHETTLDSGHKLAMNVAPFGVASQLRLQLFAELKAINIELSDDLVIALFQYAKNKDKKRLLNALQNKDMNTVKNFFAQFMGSPAFEAAVMACAARCTINGNAIKADTFEPESMRGAFYLVAWEVTLLNLAPFFEHLLSAFSSQASSEESSQE